MHILAIETTGKYGSAAVIDEAGKVHSASSREVMNHLRDIMGLVDDCLKAAGIQAGDLAAVAASVGPGSFTGIRIGVSTARAMGQMLGIPCIEVSSLAGMAEIASEESDAPLVCTIINARRKQTYGALWANSGKAEVAAEQGSANALKFTELTEQKQYMIDEILELAKTHGSDQGKAVYFMGDGIDAYEEMIREAGFADFAPEETRYQDAAAVARCALAAYEEGKTVSYDALLPNYMRKTEAEMRLEEGTLSKKIGR